jgi:hypothetical protein
MGRSRSPVHPLPRVLSMAGVAVVLAASCAPPSFRYFRDPSGTAIFKLPATWTVYDQVDLYRGQHPRVSYLTAQSATAGQWVIAFDSSSPPAISDLLSPGSSNPSGLARVQPVVDAQQQQQLSTSAGLRNAIIPLDEQIVQNPELLHIRSTQQLPLTGGFRGLRVVFEARPDPTAPYDVFNQTIVVDPAISRIFVLLIGCSAACYFGPHRGLIEEVAGSYTIKEH